jgi:hypothetical protein
MKSKHPLTAARAVLYGHLMVTLPVTMIILVITTGIAIMIGPSSADDCRLAVQLHDIGRTALGAIVGGAVAWLCWSVSIPRWRDWAEVRGADPDQTQRFGERTLLLWPKGSVFERTEIRPRKRT